MKGKTTFVALFVTLILAALGSLPAVAAEEEDACSCMCVGGSPKWVCTTAGFGNPPEPASCPTMSCPIDPDDPVEDEDDPLYVGAVVPPATGLVCQRRSVYRPDLGHYKRYSVCTPELSATHLADLAESQASWEEQLAATRARRQGISGQSNSSSNGNSKRSDGG
jgi:hypothetical protein